MSYPHDILCCTCHILMTLCVVRGISSWYFVLYMSYPHDILCRTCVSHRTWWKWIGGNFMPIRVSNPLFWHGIPARSLLVCRRCVLPFEPLMEQRDAVLVPFVLLWLNVWVFNASGHRVNDRKNMNKLTEHTVISRSVARIGIIKSL